MRLVLLKTGVYSILGLILVRLIGNNFFEIRHVFLYTLLHIAESVIMVISLVFVVYGLPGSSRRWKRLMVIPVGLFLIFYVCFLLVLNSIEMPHEIPVKADTQILYVDKDDNRKKIVIQEYWTGITGANYNADTISVYEFSSCLRLSRRMNNRDAAKIELK